MKKAVRIALPVCIAILAGVSLSLARKKGIPAPPPPVLCGCACPDGSFVITHAPSADQCPAVCEQACNNTM